MIKERIYIGSLWSLLLRLASMGFLFLSNYFLARMLPPAELGSYFLFLSIVSVLALVAQFGLGQVAVRFIPEAMTLRQTGLARSMIKFILLLSALSACGMGFGVSTGLVDELFSHLFQGSMPTRVSSVLGLWVGCLALIGVSVEIFRGFHDIRYATLFGVLAANILCTASYAFLWWGHHIVSLHDILWINGGATAVSLVAALSLILLRLGGLQRSPDGSTIPYGRVATVALPMWINNLVLFMLKQVDLWVAGAYLDQETVALYAAAARLTLVIDLPLLVINSVIPALLVELYTHGNLNKLQQLLRSLATLSSLAAFGVALLLVVFSTLILEWIYGSFYTQAYPVLWVLVIGSLVNVFTGSCGLTLSLTGQQNIVMLLSIAALGLVGVSSVWGAIHYGIMGVAYAVTLVFCVYNLAMLFSVRLKIGIWTHITVTKTNFSDFLKQ